jgi:hypothetical protein
MDASVSPKDEIWFRRVCHHISNAVYLLVTKLTNVNKSCGEGANSSGGGGRGARGTGGFGPTEEFVDIVTSNVLRYLPFSRNKPMKSADD